MAHKVKVYRELYTIRAQAPDGKGGHYEVTAREYGDLYSAREHGYYWRSLHFVNITIERTREWITTIKDYCDTSHWSE